MALEALAAALPSLMGGGGRTSVSTSQSTNIAFNPSVVIGQGASASPSGSASGSPSAPSNASGSDLYNPLASAYPSLFGPQTYQPGVVNLDQPLPQKQTVNTAGATDLTTLLLIGGAAVAALFIFGGK